MAMHAAHEEIIDRIAGEWNEVKIHVRAGVIVEESCLNDATHRMTFYKVSAITISGRVLQRDMSHWDHGRLIGRSDRCRSNNYKYSRA